MEYCGREITLENLDAIFAGYSLDTREEIRSALFRGTPILPYIERTPEDLHQIRLAMIETVPDVFFVLPAPVLKQVREYMQEGLNLNVLKPFVTQGLSEEALSAIITWARRGYPIQDCDFRGMKRSQIPLYESALAQGIDIRPYLKSGAASNAALQPLLRLARPSLLSKNLTEEQLSAISRAPALSYLTLTRATQADALEALADIYQSDVYVKHRNVVEALSAQDETGAFIYSAFHMQRVQEACEEGLDVAPLLEPTLSASLVNDIILNQRLSKPAINR